MKKITSLLLIAVMAISSIYVGSITSNATSKPKAPTSLVYDCPEVIDGANLCFKKPSDSSIKGYNIQVKDYKGNVKYNKNFSNNKFKKITSDYLKGYYWNRKDGIVKVIKKGQWYTIRMRSYKLSGNKKVYSSWSKATYGACGVTGMKAKRHGKIVKISWNKMKGVSDKNASYYIEVKNEGYTCKSNSLTVDSIKKSEKKVEVFVVCYKKVNGKSIRSDSSASYYNEEIK